MIAFAARAIPPSLATLSQTILTEFPRRVVGLTAVRACGQVFWLSFGDRRGTDRHARFALCASRRGGDGGGRRSVRSPADLAVPPHPRVLEDQSAAEGAELRRRRRHGADR